MIDPIRHEYSLTCTADHAFVVYTRRIAEWWHPRYTRDAATLRSVTIEPFVGGRVYATHTDGEDQWGEVRVWEPGRLLVHSFWLAQDPEHPSEVSVRFLPTRPSPGCRIEFAHGGWADGSEAARIRFDDWPVLLNRLVLLATE